MMVGTKTDRINQNKGVSKCICINTFPSLNCFCVVPLSSRLRTYLACSCGVTCTLLVTYYARQFRMQ